MGFFDDDEFETLLAESNKFKPQELNEGEVQAIFNRCLAKEGASKEQITASPLFSITMGYKLEDAHSVFFDKELIIANKKNILYLLGQLRNSHIGKDILTMEEAFFNYKDEKWSNYQGTVLELLYMGCTRELISVDLFDARTNSTKLHLYVVTPTLSPKDLNFPAWWETHKSEWEDED